MAIFDQIISKSFQKAYICVNIGDFIDSFCHPGPSDHCAVQPQTKIVFTVPYRETSLLLGRNRLKVGDPQRPILLTFVWPKL